MAMQVLEQQQLGASGSWLWDKWRKIWQFEFFFLLVFILPAVNFTHKWKYHEWIYFFFSLPSFL
jgi:hypothetical protein